MKTTGAYLALLATVGSCVYFFVSIKMYHASLVRLDSLTKILNNPNARVATKEQGKEVMKKLQSTKAPATTETADLEATKAEKIQSTLEKVQALLEAAKDKQAVELTPVVKEPSAPTAGFYKPPVLQAAHTPAPTANYQLDYNYSTPLLANPMPQPVMTQPTFAPAPSMIQAPIGQQPLPYPAIEAPPMQQARPQVSLDSLSKNQLVKLLLSQMNRNNVTGDIEMQ